MSVYKDLITLKRVVDAENGSHKINDIEVQYTDEDLDDFLVQAGKNGKDNLLLSLAILTHSIEARFRDLKPGIDSHNVHTDRVCPNCKETAIICACIRNKCKKCGEPVGNVTFSVCDNCFNN